jgi:hypothetical protein
MNDTMNIVNIILNLTVVEIVVYGAFSVIPISIISFYIGKYIGILVKIKNSRKGSD